MSDTEKPAVNALFEKQEAEKKKFTDSMDKESPDFKTKMKGLQKKHNEDLKAALGPDNYLKYKDLQVEEIIKEKKKG